MTISLSQQIQALHPEITSDDFLTVITLQDDGSGPYIREWNHATITQPTEAELASVDGAAYLAGVARKEAKENRASAYRLEADPLFFKAQRGEATTDEWTAKVAEIKARFPYPGGEE